MIKGCCYSKKLPVAMEGHWRPKEGKQKDIDFSGEIVERLNLSSRPAAPALSDIAPTIQK